MKRLKDSTMRICGSILAAEGDLLLLQSVQSGSGGRPAPYSKDSRGPQPGGEGNHHPPLSLRISVAVLHHPFSSIYPLSSEMDMPLKFLLYSITILSSAKDSSYSNSLRCKLLMLLCRFERKLTVTITLNRMNCVYITQSCVCSAN